MMKKIMEEGEDEAYDEEEVDDHDVEEGKK